MVREFLLSLLEAGGPGFNPQYHKKKKIKSMSQSDNVERYLNV
jgi:hypothetical protein